MPRADSVSHSSLHHFPTTTKGVAMKATNRKHWDLGTKKDSFICVALIVTAITILISGAVSVHHQNALQSEQAQRASLDA